VRHTVHELSSYKDKFENISEYVLAVRLKLINVYDAKGACVILQQFPGRQVHSRKQSENISKDKIVNTKKKCVRYCQREHDKTFGKQRKQSLISFILCICFCQEHTVLLYNEFPSRNLVRREENDVMV